MFNISLGTGAEAHGIACIAVGDGVIARGVFQVNISDKVTVPNELSKASAVAILRELDKIELTYAAFVEQKFAPEEFEPKYKKAIKLVRDLIEKHFGKDLQGLLDDISAEALEQQRKMESALAENEELKKKLAEMEEKTAKGKGKIVVRK